MRNKKAVKALKEIAKQEGVQLETIREEIALAIRLGRYSCTPENLQLWNSIPSSDADSLPTPEDVISFAAKVVKKKVI